MKRTLIWLSILIVATILIPIGSGCANHSGGTAATAGAGNRISEVQSSGAPMCTGEGCMIPGPDGKYPTMPSPASSTTAPPATQPGRPNGK